MPVKKKETKTDEPAYADEEGTFIHEEKLAKYTGGVRRYLSAAAAAAAAGAGGGGGEERASASSKTGGRSASGRKADEVATDAASAAAGGSGADSLAVFRHGRGSYTSPTLQYDGDWVEDCMEGNGTLFFVKTGSRYTGGFHRGQFEGSGTYVWADGSSYEGQWRGNRMHGTGTYTDVDGHVWTGQFFNGTGPGLERVYHRAAALTVANPLS